MRATRDPNRITFNPFSSGFRQDPYPHYRQLREARPVHKTVGMWVLTRHADVRVVLHDRTFSAALIPQQISAQTERFGQREVGRIERLGRTSLVFTDNPEHARLRALVNGVFTTRAVTGLRPAVTRIAAELLGRSGESLDLIADFAGPLPIAILCEWMALPRAAHAEVGPWTHDIRFLLEPGLLKFTDLAYVNAAIDGFTETLRPVIAERRSAPAEDLISRLVTARTQGGDTLTDDEVTALSIMCFVAGTETTKSLIGNAVLALLRHSGQAAALRANPDLIPAAVAETLRYDCPLQLTKRLATRDVEIGGEWIHAGDQVLLCLGAANRDPEVFERPDVFDLGRSGGGHLAFGHGMHGCLGGSLAVLQAEIALELLIAADVEPTATEIDWQDHSFILRGPSRLPLAIRRFR
ncbi:cytochrome P450 [Nocardia crassostreae]|uniref:cytochrome P450 n=1 Tax=Nocardia crassostreae TaxID=53428 RepID=UPI00082C8CAD|nr:cytochrome P450 [Nocardia crassostreae]